MVFAINWPFLFMLVSTSTMQSVNADDSENFHTDWQSINPSEVKIMFNNSFMSDIKFTFGTNNTEEVFYAHKFVLALSSPLFYEMFYINVKEAIVKTTIYWGDHNRQTLAGFLGFIYKDDCPADLEKDSDVLTLIIQYKIVRFYNTCRKSLLRRTQPEKAFLFVEKFLDLKAEALAEMCLSIIDALPDKYFASKHFLNIKRETLDVLIKRNTLDYNEADIFKAVLKWADHQCSLKNLETTRANRRMVLSDAIYFIRFLLMNQSEFATHVMPTNVLLDNETVAIIKTMNGEQVLDLVWDSAKLKSKRHPGKHNEEVKAKANANDSWFTYIFNWNPLNVILMLTVAALSIYFLWWCRGSHSQHHSQVKPIYSYNVNTKTVKKSRYC